MTPRARITRRLGIAAIIAFLPLLTACGDRSWDGIIEDRIDTAVAGVDFSSVGGINCDYRRPGNTIAGSSASRYVGVDGSDNGQAVVDLLVASGFTSPHVSLSDAYTQLSNGDVEIYLLNSDGVNISVTTMAGGDRSYAFGNCVTPAEGSVSMLISAGGG